MANNSLSEFWLLKHLGDTHWQLLTKGFDKKSSEFKNDNNNRLYATFIRIKYEVSPLFTFYENEEISFRSMTKCAEYLAEKYNKTSESIRYKLKAKRHHIFDYDIFYEM